MNSTTIYQPPSQATVQNATQTNRAGRTPIDLDLTEPVDTADPMVLQDALMQQAATENSDHGSSSNSNKNCGSNKTNSIGDSYSNSRLLSGMPEDQRTKRVTANPKLDEERLGGFREQSPGDSQGKYSLHIDYHSSSWL
jgi:hypothetical protein